MIGSANVAAKSFELRSALSDPQAIAPVTAMATSTSTRTAEGPTEAHTFALE
jgi:hypothetical protein